MQDQKYFYTHFGATIETPYKAPFTYMRDSEKENLSYDSHLLKMPPQTSRCYESLCIREKRKIASYCIGKVNAYLKQSKIRNFFKTIESFFGPEEYPFEIRVHPEAYKIIEYLKIVGVKQKGIFRVPGSATKYKEIAFHLHTKSNFDWKHYEINDLASGIKSYIRDYLKGFIPRDVSNALIKIYASNDVNAIRGIRKYLPFIFDSNSRKLMLEFFDLLNEIDAHSGINFMTMDNLMRILPFTFFSEEFCRDFSVVGPMISIIVDLLKLDYKTIPIDLYYTAI